MGIIFEDVYLLNFGDYVYVGSKELKMNLNWKLVNDMWGEIYYFLVFYKDIFVYLYLGYNLNIELYG